VTGSALLADGVTQHAFLYSNGKMLDLNSLLSPSQASVITLTVGRAINDSGQIVADGHDSNTSQDATFLLTPINAAAPMVMLSNASLRFRDQRVDSSSPPQTVTVNNTGTTSLAISSITLTGRFADDFILTSTCGASLAASASCLLTVTFRPVAVGPKNATIRLQDNASGSPQAVVVTGLGIPGTALKLSAGHLKFARQAVGTISTAKIVTLTNRGTAAVRLHAIALNGREADDFVLRDRCGAWLAANAGCAISVAFKPASSGAKSATVIIRDSAEDSPQLIRLLGIGVRHER
jgi:probable HAF family extracellular repeat protein